MKKIKFLLIAMLMSFGTSTFAGTTTTTNDIIVSQKISIPVNIIIKQTITFKDGKSISVYYKKEGDICKLYSQTDITKYKESDLSRIKSTNFEIADSTEGKCIMTKKTKDVISLAKSIFGQIK